MVVTSQVSPFCQVQILKGYWPEGSLISFDAADAPLYSVPSQVFSPDLSTPEVLKSIAFITMSSPLNAREKSEPSSSLESLQVLFTSCTSSQNAGVKGSSPQGKRERGGEGKEGGRRQPGAQRFQPVPGSQLRHLPSGARHSPPDPASKAI